MAADDLESICTYIAVDSERYSKIFAQEMVDFINMIPAFPYSGRSVPKYYSEKIREKMFKSYRVIYRVHEEYIEVVRIMHQSRQVRIHDNAEE